MTQSLKVLFILAAGYSLTACTVRETVREVTNDPNALEVLASAGISVVTASGEECPAGGNVYRVYRDENDNGNYDDPETVLSQQIVCNGEDGSNGTNGLTTLFALTRVEMNSETCTSQSGLQINYGLDTNRSSALDPSEIAATQILCDGANGESGAAGTPGSNGYSMAFNTVAASPQQCAAGGSVIFMALDTNRNNAFDSTDSNIQSVTMCNGQNGQNGTNAVLPAYTPVEPIFPCNNTDNYDEVLLRLNNGQVLASFSDNTSGKMTRLTFVPDGNFMTTDNNSCHFSLSTSGSTRSISWSSQIQKSWQISY